jgi:hypothetical protein
MKKSASVYNRTGFLYFLSSSQTTVDVWIENDSIIKLDEAAPENEKGEAILRSLSESIQGIPHPTTWPNEDDNPFWKVAGASSWTTFVKGTLSVDIELENDRLTFSPYKNKGAKEGFIPLTAKNISLHCDASPNEIGTALNEAFALCE